MWRDQKGDRREMAEAPEEHHSPPPATVGEVASQIQATCRDMSSLLEGHCKDVCEKDDRIRGDAAKVPPLPVLQACASGPAGRGGPARRPPRPPVPCVALGCVARRDARCVTACRACAWQIDELEQKLHKFQYSLDWLESKVKEVRAPPAPSHPPPCLAYPRRRRSSFHAAVSCVASLRRS